MLIVLDNFEQIVDAAPQIVELYSLAPDAAFLVTSRILLRIRGERVYEVPPLATADAAAPHSVTRAASAPAVELFVERARAVKPDFTLTPSNTAAVVAVCQALDGLPLAIELAAARMRLLTPAGILQRLDGRLRLLVDSSRDLPNASAPCARRSMVDGLLGEDQRRLLCDLGVFSAGFTLEAVESIGAGRVWEAEAVAALEALVDSSLVSQSDVDGEAVFSMLVTVREYAVEKLASGRGTQDARRARAYIDDLTRRMSSQLNGPTQRETALRLDLERGNLRTAIRHLVDVGNADLATSIAWRMYVYWWLRGFFYEVGVWMRELLERVPDASEHARAVALFFHLWSAMWNTDKGDEIIAGLAGAADLFEASGDEFGASMARATKCFAKVTLGQPDGAVIGELEECAASFRRSGHRWAETLALIAVGRVAGALGQPAEATRYFSDALTAAEAAATRSRRRLHATTSRASCCSPARRMPPNAASATHSGSRSRSGTTRASRMPSRACAQPPRSAETSRSPRRSPPPPIRRGTVSSCSRPRSSSSTWTTSTPPPHRRMRMPSAGDGPGRDMSAAEAAELRAGERRRERRRGVTRQIGRACRNRMRVPGRAWASRSSAASVTTAITG
jgi:predicted ATPase